MRYSWKRKKINRNKSLSREEKNKKKGRNRQKIKIGQKYRGTLKKKIKEGKFYTKKGSGINKTRGGAIFYYNPRDLFERLELLGGSIMAGNNSAKNEFSEVAHTLYKFGLFSSEVLNSLLRKFIEIK